MSEPKRPVLVYLTDSERQVLQQRADEEDRSLSAMARQLLRAGLGIVEVRSNRA